MSKHLCKIDITIKTRSEVGVVERVGGSFGEMKGYILVGADTGCLERFR